MIDLTTQDKLILLGQGMGQDNTTMRLMARASLEDSKQALEWGISMMRQEMTMHEILTYINKQVIH